MELPEWMDGPCRFEDLQACLRDLDRVNQLTLGFRPTLSFLDQVCKQNHSGQVLRILDVGFGSGAMLRKVYLWAQKRCVAVELIGIDLNPLAGRVAMERYGDAPIKWLTGNALTYSAEVDVVISSLLTHHLQTVDVVAFLAWMEAAASLGWFINDLERTARSAQLFSMLARVMRWHAFVQHDGPVSFARSFVAEDWHRMLAQAGLRDGTAQLVRSFPSRLCVRRLR